MSSFIPNTFVFALFLFFNLSLLVLGQGTQFITGPCTSDADCASGCCGFTSGKCAGPIVAQERDGGCGFGETAPNDNAADALVGQEAAADATLPDPTAATTPNTDPAEPVTSPDTAMAAAAPGTNFTDPAVSGQLSNSTAGAANEAPVYAGTQFITGPCTSDADCASGCCGFNSGTCAGPVVAQERDGGCGFGDAQPNDDAAQAVQGKKIKRGVLFSA
ncbi:hypothetical protein AJ79_03739 [Helicocarpus griseus UAMH5409]|uniref:Biotrophy-associated secreted protein 2 n=1 Tax=Helicocarpus griseus UAMH5409 TaxID=1447875 RepID=A0A2B7XXH1_9EURO|nr:hypothetical protein AJ79_03739 [Helicocarpus griseus UAMH5409]